MEGVSIEFPMFDGQQKRQTAEGVHCLRYTHTMGTINNNICMQNNYTLELNENISYLLELGGSGWKGDRNVV